MAPEVGPADLQGRFGRTRRPPLIAGTWTTTRLAPPACPEPDAGAPWGYDPTWIFRPGRAPAGPGTATARLATRRFPAPRHWPGGLHQTASHTTL